MVACLLCEKIYKIFIGFFPDMNCKCYLALSSFGHCVKIQYLTLPFTVYLKTVVSFITLLLRSNSLF